MDAIKRIVLANRAWSKERLSVDPDYFRSLGGLPSPEILWIGASDTPISPEELTGTAPGELLVHRNIANLVVHTDLSLMAVLHHAVVRLGVAHVVVCGHYACAGVTAALKAERNGISDKWVRYIKDIWRLHRAELELYDDPEQRRRRLVEINVLEQVHNLVKTAMIQEAWRERGGPTLHGVVYGDDDGLLRELCEVPPGSPIDEIYRFEP